MARSEEGAYSRYGIAVDTAGNAYVAGVTGSAVTDAKPTLDSPEGSKVGNADELSINLYGCGCRMVGRRAQHGGTLLLAAALLLAAGLRKRLRIQIQIQKVWELANFRE
ncbi:MAG: SBBP repeat-containing protein [Pseudomonadota bacterium]